MKFAQRVIRVFGLVLVVSVCPAAAIADYYDEGQIITTQTVMKDKKVAFLAMSMGMGIDQIWQAALKRDSERYGYELIVRDYNWTQSSETQAFNQLISEKPDIIILQPIDMNADTKQIKRAQEAGIHVVQMNLKTPTNTAAYVGADWYAIGKLNAETMVKYCGKGSNSSGKIAIIQGVLTTPASKIQIQGVEDVLSQNSDIKVVANQAADWDATKAHAVTGPILKQNADLCGIIGFWEVMDMGTAAAIKEAGLQGKVALVTSGGGEVNENCVNVDNGTFTADISYDARGEATALADAVSMILQSNPPVGKSSFGLYTHLHVNTKENLHDGACWSLDDVSKHGFR